MFNFNYFFIMTNFRIEEKQFVDKTTGEIITQEIKKSWTYKYKPDKFYRVYFDWTPFENHLTAQAKTLMNYLCTHAEYNTGKVLLPASERNELCNSLQITTSRLSQLFKELINTGAITGERGVFYINPQLFWLGDSLTRDEMLKNGNIEFTISLKPDSKVYNDFLKENNLEEVKAD